MKTANATPVLRPNCRRILSICDASNFVDRPNLNSFGNEAIVCHVEAKYLFRLSRGTVKGIPDKTLRP